MMMLKLRRSCGIRVGIPDLVWVHKRKVILHLSILILPPALFCNCSHRVTLKVTVSVMSFLSVFEGNGMVVVASSTKARREWD